MVLEAILPLLAVRTENIDLWLLCKTHRFRQPILLQITIPSFSVFSARFIWVNYPLPLSYGDFGIWHGKKQIFAALPLQVSWVF